MKNHSEENVAEHSFDVALITHALCIIKNKCFGGDINYRDAVLTALYHETAEAITGDLPTPVKYFNPEMTKAYKNIEKEAEQTLLSMLPDYMRDEIAPYVKGERGAGVSAVVKAADKIAAYIKCIEEKKSGNGEFDKAAVKIRAGLLDLNMPEVSYFLDNFLEGYMLTLDELNE